MKAASVTRIKDYGKHLGRHLGASGGIWEASGLLDGASPGRIWKASGSIGEASVRHLEASRSMWRHLEASGWHLGGIWEASGGIWEASGLLDGASPKAAGSHRKPPEVAGEPPEDWIRPGRSCGPWVLEESFASQVRTPYASIFDTESTQACRVGPPHDRWSMLRGS